MSVAPVATKMRVAAPSPGIDLHWLWQAVAHLRTIKGYDQAPQFRGIEAGIDLDPKPLSKYDPKLSIPCQASCLHRAHTRSTILNHLDRNTLLPRSPNTPAPCIERMHAQPMRRTKLLAP